MTPPSVPNAPSSQPPDSVPPVGGSVKAVDESVDPFDKGSISGVPTRALGATGVLDCKIWSTDFRERLEEGNPLRAGFQASPEDGSEGAVERLEKLHQAALRVTTIDR